MFRPDPGLLVWSLSCITVLLLGYMCKVPRNPRKRAKCRMRSTRWIATVSPRPGRYKCNPYHSAMHAADVTSRLCAILHHTGIAKDMLATEGGDLQLLAMVLSAVVHDLEHPGTTNQYAVLTRLEPAKLFNDQSVRTREFPVHYINGSCNASVCIPTCFAGSDFSSQAPQKRL